jgi:hypothetical protein
MQTLYFTVKEWNRFDWNKQQVLTKKYIVILLDYKTRKEKILQVLDKINFKNLNKGIAVFNKGMDGFNKSVQQFGDSMGKMNDELSKDVKRSNESARISEDKDKQNLEKIWGKPRKLQNNTVKFWSDPPKSDADSQKSDRGIW